MWFTSSSMSPDQLARISNEICRLSLLVGCTDTNMPPLHSINNDFAGSGITVHRARSQTVDGQGRPLQR
jgi:hypothetical protein